MPAIFDLLLQWSMKKCEKLTSMNPSLGTNKLAVLTAINAVNDYLKLKDRLEQHEKELKRVKD